MSNLVEHAKAELTRAGEEPEAIEWYLRVIAAYAEFGHSGGSHMACLPVLIKLLNGENLTPITKDTDEWEDRSEISGYPLWQNKRNSRLMSTDGGVSYWDVEDNFKRRHFSKPVDAASV